MPIYTKEIGIRNFYENYRDIELREGRKPRSYQLFSKILRDFNLLLRDAIIYQAQTIELPFKLGKLGVRKFSVNYKLNNKNNWRVDFKATKEAGKVVYYGSDYGYKWKWNKSHVKLRGKRHYSFKPCRKASRLIADAVNNKKLDFYS